MEQSKTSKRRQVTNKLYGGLELGWYIRKRSWLSLLIISPALVFQTVVGVGALMIPK